MNGEQGSFFNIWEMILSRQPGVIGKAFDSLAINEQNAVLDHLRRMSSESGWQPAQRESARIALEVISELGE
jgi:hypothetical protein